MSAEEPTGLLFDIQRFCTTDGPGIRTVVFFKGCNMHCPWCHNPEGIATEPDLEFDAKKCIGCGRCLNACQYGAQQMTASGLHTIDRSRCKRCMACVRVCPAGALQQVGRRYTLEACFAEIAEDIPFYKSSGGGVTLSGGEALLQADFAAALLARCHEAGIHTAIETNLSLPFSEVEKLLPALDLAMVDIKCMDDAEHQRLTGESNVQTLESLGKLSDLRVPLIVRTPVVPGMNDTEENIEATAMFLSTLKTLQYYELLSYTPLGCDKAARIGVRQHRFDLPEKAAMRRLAAVAAKHLRVVWLDGRLFHSETGGQL